MKRSYGKYFSDNVNSFNISGTNITSTINLTTATDMDERSQVLSWISPLEPWKRHQDVSNDRVSGVGDWVLGTAEFEAWRDGNSTGSADRTLFCSGIPGAGKTFFSSLVIDSLCNTTAGSNIAIACLYCDYRGQKEQTPVGMIGSLMRQLVTSLPEIPKELIQAFKAARRQLNGRALQMGKILEMFPQVLQSFEKVFICIDALDEFQVEHRVAFLQSLKQIMEKSPDTRLFLTGRPHIQLELDKHLAKSSRVITIQPSPDDIKIFLTNRLDADPEPDLMEDKLRSEIIEKISREHSEIFLLVALHIDAILCEVTIGERRERLCQIAGGLSDAYSATLERIKRQREVKAKLGIVALMWISLAERPLSVPELCHALGVKVGAVDLDTQKIPSIETILGCCLGLVTVDRETSTVRLIHATLQEYLRDSPDIFDNPHSKIAEACLTYLSFQSVIDLSPAIKASPPTHPLLAYSSCYWGAHARKGLTQSVESLAIPVLRPFPDHVASTLFVLNEKDVPWKVKLNPNFVRPSGLHYAACFGIHKLVASLLDMGIYDPNQKDLWGRTPLAWAVKNRHEGAMQILLDQVDINPNSKDGKGQTALSFAAENGYDGVVKMLLSRDNVNPNSQDIGGQTPLSCATRNGHESVVQMLLGRADTDPNSKDISGQTPISCAARNGYEGIVKMLLGRADIDPNSKDISGKTAISRAAESGYEGVVKILLDRVDVNPNSKDGRGQTPLFCAARNGNERVVKILLDRPDVDPNSKDNDGQTPISCATDNAFEGVVKILLSRADIDPNSKDMDDQTPISCAVRNRWEGVVKMLLDRADVDPNSQDIDGQTPISCAAHQGYEGIVKVLLNRADVNPNSKDINNQTPLSHAVLDRHGELVKMLLARADVDVNSKGASGRTPLTCAAWYGYEAAVKMLLERPNIDPNSKDDNGQTPISCASRQGHERIVDMLLGRDDVDQNSADNLGLSPVQWASKKGHTTIIRLLQTSSSARAAER